MRRYRKFVKQAKIYFVRKLGLKLGKGKITTIDAFLAIRLIV